jgi:hypothetical protein
MWVLPTVSMSRYGATALVKKTCLGQHPALRHQLF